MKHLQKQSQYRMLEESDSDDDGDMDPEDAKRLKYLKDIEEIKN